MSENFVVAEKKPLAFCRKDCDWDGFELSEDNPFSEYAFQLALFPYRVGDEILQDTLFYKINEAQTFLNLMDLVDSGEVLMAWSGSEFLFRKVSNEA